MFGSKDKAAIGIDIGASSIKLVELEGRYCQPKLVSWGVAKLKAGAFCESAIVDFELTTAALHKAMIDSGASGDTAVVSVSSSQAMTKILTVANDIDGIELEEQVNVEASQIIPNPLDEVNIDFTLLGPSTTKPGDNDVLLVACRRSIIEGYINLINELGLRLSCIDIDTYALERAYRSQHSDLGSFRANGKSLLAAIFDIGFSSSHLVILDGQNVLYSGNQNFGVSSLVQRICEEYVLSAEAAENLLCSLQLPSDFRTRILEPFVARLQQEMGSALQFFYSSSVFSCVDQIILTGACSSLNGLVSALQAKMSISVVALNPFGEIEIQSSRKANNTLTSGLAIAYGLSLRGLM